MRYFRYNEPRDPKNGDFTAETITLSEQEILDYYWDYWYDTMCNKFSKETVDQKYTQTDCIRDWKVIHWAWEVEDHQGER